MIKSSLYFVAGVSIAASVICFVVVVGIVRDIRHDRKVKKNTIVVE